jgi:CcmD family protein
MLLAGFYLTILLQTAQDPDRFNNFLLLAYGVMWLVVLVYLLNLANKQRNLRQDIRLMHRLLEEDKADGGA